MELTKEYFEEYLGKRLHDQTLLIGMELGKFESKFELSLDKMDKKFELSLKEMVERFRLSLNESEKRLERFTMDGLLAQQEWMEERFRELIESNKFGGKTVTLETKVPKSGITSSALI